MKVQVSSYKATSACDTVDHHTTWKLMPTALTHHLIRTDKTAFLNTHRKPLQWLISQFTGVYQCSHKRN